MRHGMWEKVAARSHKPAQIYAFSKSSDDVMLHGTVDYELKDGKKAEGIEWAARAHFSPLGGQPKMDFYQVYLVRRSGRHHVARGPMLMCAGLGCHGCEDQVVCCSNWGSQRAFGSLPSQTLQSPYGNVRWCTALWVVLKLSNSRFSSIVATKTSQFALPCALSIDTMKLGR